MKRAIWACVWILCWPLALQGQVPSTLHYQGFLTSSSGAPINGTVAMTVSLYGAAEGGAALWSEVQNVSVVNGVYSIVLGSATPLNLGFNVPYYLGVAVAPDPEMTPRRPLTSAGYAIRARTAEVVGSHTHSGSDITSGIVAQERVDALIARDSEVSTAVSAHAARTDNPHATTASQVGAAAAVHGHAATDITSGTLSNTRFSAYSDLSAEGYLSNTSDSALLTRVQADTRYVNTGQVDGVTSAMIAAGAVTSAKASSTLMRDLLGLQLVTENATLGNPSSWPTTEARTVACPSGKVAIACGFATGSNKWHVESARPISSGCNYGFTTCVWQYSSSGGYFVCPYGQENVTLTATCVNASAF
jgi:hypothetical protein